MNISLVDFLLFICRHDRIGIDLVLFSATGTFVIEVSVFDLRCDIVASGRTY